MVLEYNCWKQLNTSNRFPQQNDFGIPIRWWWWTTVLMMRLKILETISTTKWFWHSGTVMMMNDGVDDEIEDSGNHFQSKMVLEFDSQKPFPQQNGFCIPVRWWWRWWWWTTVLMMRLKILRLVRFVLFCLVSFGGVGSNYVRIYARCIRIFLCTITTPVSLLRLGIGLLLLQQ